VPDVREDGKLFRNKSADENHAPTKSEKGTLEKRGAKKKLECATRLTLTLARIVMLGIRSAQSQCYLRSNDAEVLR